MKPITILILKYAGILSGMFLILWWTIFFSSFNIPEFIPHTPIKIYGLFLCGFILTILIFSQKELLRKNETFSIGNLTLIGTAICFINEVVFQFILSFTNEIDKLYYFFSGVISTTIFSALLSFLLAFQLKTRRTGQLLLFILTIIILFKGLIIFFPSLEQNK